MRKRKMYLYIGKKVPPLGTHYQASQVDRPETEKKEERIARDRLPYFISSPSSF